MSKVYKLFALILGVLILLFAGITLFVRLYLTSELITAWITPPFEHYLQRDVRLTGAKIGLRGFCVEGLEILKQGASTPLLKSAKLELRWKYSELVKGRIVIHTLAFSKPEIVLFRHEDGLLNISDLLPQKSSSEPAALPGKRAKSEPSGVPLFISLLAMENGRLTLIDRSRQPQATLQVTNLRSRINDLSTLTPISFEVEGKIEGEDKGSFKISGTFDQAKSNVQGNLNFQEIDLVTLKPFFAKEPLEVLQQGSLTLDTSLAVEEYDRIKCKGSFNLTGLQMKQDEDLYTALELEAGFQLDAVVSQQTLSFDSLHLALNGQKAKIQGLLTQWYQRPQLNFTLSSSQIKLDEILALLPKGSLPSGTGETTIEQVTVQGKPATENLGAEPGTESLPASDAPVNQPEKPNENPQSASDSATATDQAAETVTALVATATRVEAKPETTSIPLDAQGDIHLDWLFYNKLVVSNVDLQLRLFDGKLQLEPLSATIYGGGLGASVKADVESLGPRFQCHVHSENVLLDEVVEAFWPATHGKWSGNINQTSRASGIGPDLRAIEVHTDLNINQAEFSNHPLFLKLAELFQTQDLQQLQFTQVTARILTSKGVANIKRLHMVGPILQVEGRGTVGLLDKKLDLRLHLQIRTQYVGKLASLREFVPKISEQQGFVQLPLNVSGTLDEPLYRLDEGWLAGLAKEVAEEPVNELEQKALSTSLPSEMDKAEVEEEPQKIVQ